MTAAPERTAGKGLANGTLGLWGSTVIGLASTAPVYSLVATLGFVVLAVGASAPIAFIIAFIPMLFIAFAYRELNNAVPDCGTTFTWSTKAFGPWIGWMGGWGVAVAGMVVLANLSQIAGVYLWSLVGDGSLAENAPLVTVTGVAFIAAMTFISYRGVEIGERVQNILLAVQYLVLALFVVLALWKFFDGTAPNPTPFDIGWFNPFGFDDFSGFTEAVLLALFIYWGWDTCLALNEETKDPTRIPGRAALLTTVILLGLAFLGAMPFLQRERRLHISPRAGVWGAPLLGIVFGLGWAPCIGPTLAAVQSLAIGGGDPVRALVLVLLYCLGLGPPFVLVAMGLKSSTRMVAFLRRHRLVIMRAGGGLLILLGLALVTGLWSRWAGWLQGLIDGFTTVV